MMFVINNNILIQNNLLIIQNKKSKLYLIKNYWFNQENYNLEYHKISKKLKKNYCIII